MVDVPAGLPSSPPSAARLGPWRLAAGLAQGLSLLLLYYAADAGAWPATRPPLFAALALAALFLPPLFVTALGHARPRRLGGWLLAAALLAGILGWHAMARLGEPLTVEAGLRLGWWSLTPSGPVLWLGALGFFMAQALVLAAPAGAGWRRWFHWPYAGCFGWAWKLAIQVLFSLLFVGVLWLLLWLGAALFMLVKLDFLRSLMQKPWFYLPLTACTFSVTLHLSDVRPAIVEQVRQLLLTMLAWLLPVAVLLVGGFLCLLPITGMAPLWATRHAAAVLLSAAVILILLANTVFQDGEHWQGQPALLRLALRAASLLLAPLAALAIHALTLRVQQYGWSSSRILGAAALAVATVHALGYLTALLSRQRFAARLAVTNVAAALLALVLLTLLGTPLADPARLAVQQQLGRLHRGEVAPRDFDYDYLRFEGERYGRAALEDLRQASGPDAEAVRAGAQAALDKPLRWQPGEPASTAAAIAANLTLQPADARLPAGFLEQDWQAAARRHPLPPCLTMQNQPCTAYLIDLDADGRAEVLVQARNAPLPLAVFGARSRPAGKNEEETATAPAWDYLGTLGNAGLDCQRLADALAGGDYALQVPRVRELVIQGQRLQLQPPQDSGLGCKEEK